MRLYSTCPQSKHFAAGSYLAAVRRTARWSEAHGCEGMLIYTDNGLMDPWLVAQATLEATERLIPLVALQPVYLHPYSAAKMVASLAFLYERPMALNLVAGGFRNDLLALGDDTPHDERYTRLTEYVRILSGLLADEAPVTLNGRYYRVENLRLTPALPEALRPALLLSGSSEAGRSAAATLGAVAIRYPEEPATEAEAAPRLEGPSGLRVGIVAREDRETAWAEAWSRFPADRKGQLTHQLAMRTSDSQWHHTLSERADAGTQTEGLPGPSPYWLHPFRQYQTFCPYLVGDHDEVAVELGRYAAAGDELLIVDIPRCEADLAHTQEVVARIGASA